MKPAPAGFLFCIPLKHVALNAYAALTALGFMASALTIKNLFVRHRVKNHA